MIDPTDPKDATRSHEHRFELAASPEVVWRTITQAEELVKWFPLQAEAHPGPGGTITYGWGDLVGRCTIQTWDPPRHLRTTWMDGSGPDGSSDAARRAVAVDWFIEAAGGRTVLRLVHSGFGRDAAWDDEFDGTRRGWAFELASLELYLRRHLGGTRRAFWAVRPTTLPAAGIWRRLTRKGGLLRDGEPGDPRVGDRCRIALSSGDEVHGVVLVNAPPVEFAATAENWNHGLFRFGFEKCHGTQQAHVWWSTWDLPAREVAALEERCKAALQRALA